MLKIVRSYAIMKKIATTFQSVQIFAEPMNHVRTRQAKKLEQSTRKGVKAAFKSKAMIHLKILFCNMFDCDLVAPM